LSSADIKAEEEEARERQNSTGCRSGDKGSKEGKEQKKATAPTSRYSNQSTKFISVILLKLDY